MQEVVTDRFQSAAESGFLQFKDGTSPSHSSRMAANRDAIAPAARQVVSENDGDVQ